MRAQIWTADTFVDFDESVAGAVEHILGRCKESSQRSQTNCASALAQHQKSKIRESG
jgi:hypothetical protein